MISKPKRLPSATACRIATWPNASGAVFSISYVCDQHRLVSNLYAIAVAGVPSGKIEAMSGLAAVIFDFDGIVLDSETPEYESHRRIYQQYGVTLTVDEWC